MSIKVPLSNVQKLSPALKFGQLVSKFQKFCLRWTIGHRGEDVDCVNPGPVGCNHYILVTNWRQTFYLGPQEFSAQVGPARLGEILRPSRPGPREFSAQVGPARSQMAEISNTGPVGQLALTVRADHEFLT